MRDVVAARTSAQRPPFAFRVEGPDDWSVLRTDPQAWQADAERLVDEAVRGGDVPAQVRRALLDGIDETVSIAQRAGTVLALVKIGTQDRRPFVASLTLTFVDTSPMPASIALVQQAFHDVTGSGVELFDTPSGEALLLSRIDDAPAGVSGLFSADRSVSVAQAYVPLPHTTWTAIVGATSTRSNHVQLLQSLVARMAHTLERRPRAHLAPGTAAACRRIRPRRPMRRRHGIPHRTPRQLEAQHMGSKFSITDNAVGAHASNLDTTTGSMNVNLNQFISGLASLPSVWKGAAFSSFDQVQRRWEAATRDLNAALADISGRVGNSAQIYDQSHAEQTANINGINASANWDASKFRG